MGLSLPGGLPPALVGHAARFVEPIFSSGVTIALNSAKLAANDILQAVEQEKFGKDRFGPFESTMRCGTRNWYEFISSYYRLNMLFTLFVQNRRYRLDVLKLLQDDMYDEDQASGAAGNGPHRLRG
jgi:1H-pyrrole-2-carbonyl-[peptidyl-carrier protein] chlorinase